MNRKVVSILTLVMAVLWTVSPGPVAEIARAADPPIGYGEGTTILVNTTEDAIWPDGNCSLREAIRTSNLNDWVDACALGSGRDTILVPAGLYVLDTPCQGEDEDGCGDLDITDSVTILGKGAGKTVIDGSGIDRLVEVAPGTGVEIEGLTLANGRVSGERGGAILNRGYLTLYGVTVRDSVAAGSLEAAGGGLANVADLSDATANVYDSRIESNRAYAGGGLLSEASEPYVGTLRLVRSTIDGNSAVMAGGGIYQSRGSGQYGGAVSLTVDSSTISRNTSASQAAGSGNGGGIAIAGGSATVVNSTISSNRASGSGQPQLSGVGGGIYVVNQDSWPSIYLLNSTVAENRSTAGGPGIAAANLGESGAGLSVYLKNSIIAGNRVRAGTGRSCLILDWGIGEVTLASLGHNLEDGQSCKLGQETDWVNTDPLLAPLGDYGGGTQTHLLQSGSTAIDRGDDWACPCGDQRGVARPQGDASDIGSVEVEVEPDGPKQCRLSDGQTLLAWEPSVSRPVADIYTSTTAAPRPEPNSGPPQDADLAKPRPRVDSGPAQDADRAGPRPEINSGPPGQADLAGPRPEINSVLADDEDMTLPRPATDQVTDEAATACA